MTKKTIPLAFVILMMSSVFMAPQMTNISMLDFTPEQKNQVAETDLDRVTWEANVAPNKDFENWNSPRSPNNLETDLTIEKAAWFETAVVYEGSQSIGMHSRALDTLYSGEYYLTQSWVQWDNPINTTLDLDWYLDEIGNPVSSDYFLIRVRMNGLNMLYYLGCSTTQSNGTRNAIFNIDGPTQVWNHLHRNLTSDYIDVFGVQPATFGGISWWIRSFTNEYTRVFMDDVNLVNSSYTYIGESVRNGNFEDEGGWIFLDPTDPADVSQSSVSHEGSWSMNMTAISFDYLASARAQVEMKRRLSNINQGQMSFWWRIDEWVNSTSNTFSFVRIDTANTTHEVSMYYYLCVGGAGNLPPLLFGNDMKFQVDSFNVTDTWNFFECNIWEDFHTFSTTHDLWIEKIEFSVSTSTDDSRLSILFDELIFTASIVNDGGYETQAGIGTPIRGGYHYFGDDSFTVTDFTYSGNKGANLTLKDHDFFLWFQQVGYIQFDSTTELILDFSVYIDTFNETAEDYIFFDLGFDSGHAISYVIANLGSKIEDWFHRSTSIIVLQETIITGNWLNFQLDLVHDFESIYGRAPDTTLNWLSLAAFASENSKLVVYLDDLYIYYDPAPEVNDVGHSPLNPVHNGFVTISATVVDATIDTVVVNYRVASGSWKTLAMNQISGSSFETNITSLKEGDVFEYNITAADAFGKSTDALNGTAYFSFTVGPTFSILPILAVGVMFVVGAVVVLYMYRNNAFHRNLRIIEIQND